MKKWYDDSYWHRPLLDLWTIPHTLFGVLVACLTLYGEIKMMAGFIATLVVAILWELGEMTLGISSDEDHSNKISDIIVACIGYGAVWYVALKVLPEQSTAGIWAIIAFAALMISSVIGWRGYYLWNKQKK